MEIVNVSDENLTNAEFRNLEGNTAQVDDFNPKVEDLFATVDKLEQRVNEIELFYLNANIKEPNTSRSASIPKDKEKEKHIPSMKKLHQDASRREAAAGKRMQELMRYFGTIFRQIIDRPMDFSTIKNQMEAKGGTGYKHIHEICSDVRLVFKNAMKYNDEKSDVHVMAKILLEKFEDKWLQILPKVIEEEEKREAEESESLMNIQLALEAAYAKLARDINNELYEVDTYIDREKVIKKCRKISTMEKRKVGIAVAQLCPENLIKALEIAALDNPNFQATAEEVELDINAQSESTLWRLKFFVKDVLKVKSKSSSKDENNGITSQEAADNHENNIVSKRKREICDALAKTARKRKKKVVLLQNIE